jgi:prepilin-type N-terminal cleavage/methylation domain-containing protein
MPFLNRCLSKSIGFTLPELLICLTILAEIATFTIPKLLTAQQNTQYNAKAKEAASIVAAAFQQAQITGQVTASTTGANLTQYINYVATTTASIDATPNDTGTQSCASPYTCIKLHNGGVILFDTGSFGGTATTNGVWFEFDPDGVLTSNSTTTGAGQSVQFWLYYTGRISELGSIAPNTTNFYQTQNANSARTPSWFSW